MIFRFEHLLAPDVSGLAAFTTSRAWLRWHAIENGRHCPEFRQLSAGSQEPASVLRGVSDRGDHSNGMVAGGNHCSEKINDGNVIDEFKARIAAKYSPEQERPVSRVQTPNIMYSAPLSNQELEEKKRLAFALAEKFSRSSGS
jgi:hypothetical protein